MEKILNTESLFEKYGVNYKAGDIIFFEGDFAEDFYIVHSGVVKAVKFLNNRIIPLKKFKKGNLFGEFAVFSDNIRTATVIADTDVILVKINNANLLKIIGSTDFAWEFLISITEKIEYTLELLTILKTGSIERKLFIYLAFMVKHKNATIDISDIPDAILGPESIISEILDKWKKQGLITIVDKFIWDINEVSLKQHVK